MDHGGRELNSPGGEPYAGTRSSYRAVREAAASFHMDWPVHQPDDSAALAEVRIFILDESDRRVSDVACVDASDDAADQALTSVGWTRRGTWQPDVFGRMTARVVASAAREAIPLPRQRTAGLIDEATLHHA